MTERVHICTDNRPLRAGLRSLTTNNEAVQTGVKYLQNQTARGLIDVGRGRFK